MRYWHFNEYITVSFFFVTVLLIGILIFNLSTRRFAAAATTAGGLALFLFVMLFTNYCREGASRRNIDRKS